MHTMTARTTCPKCAGTGTVSRFRDYKAGVCFDCNGAGTITAPVTVTVTDYSTARKVADVALSDPTSVDADTARTALAIMRERQHAWNRRDYARQNALIAITG